MSSVIELRDPRTGRSDGRVEAASPDVVRAEADRLRAGQEAWNAAGVDARCDALAVWADAIEAHRASLVQALLEDTGRIHESHMEVDGVIGALRRWAGQARVILAPEVPRTAAYPAVQVHQVNDPYPVVGVISPWNFPLLLSLIDAVPALAAGAAVLVKPSEITPRFVPVLRRTVEAVPGLVDVVGLVVGDGATGRAVVDVADAICFTGSVPTGRLVAAQAAARMIPASLELGGKDPAVVLPGADLPTTTRALLWGGTANAGQSCLSIERVYVHTSVHDDLVDRLVDAARAVGLAHPAPQDGAIGPIIAARQIDVIDAHLRDAVARGATIRHGGTLEVLDGGTYLRPTIVTGVDHSMALMTDETFGPILPVMAYDTVDQAVALANDTAYGLSAAVFGPQDQAIAVAGRIRAGAVSVNDAALTAIVHDGEKNAYGASGLGGTRMGPGSLRRFLRRRAHLVKQTDAPDPWWFPAPATQGANA